jgi:hypothetical protein
MNNLVFRDTLHVFKYLNTKFGMPSTAYFEKVKTKTIYDTCGFIIVAKANEPTADTKVIALAKKIARVILAQNTYRPMHKTKEYLFEQPDGTHEKIHFTIGPYKDGVECYIIYADGMYERIDSIE